MQNTLFYKSGLLIYTLRWVIIFLWIILLCVCIPFLPKIIEPFKTTGFIDEKSPSALAQVHADSTLRFNHKNKFLLIYQSPKLLATHARFKQKIKQSLEGLDDFPIQHEIIYPDNKNQISKDKHTAYVVVILKSKEVLSQKLLEQFKTSIKTPSNMSLILGGEPLFVDGVNRQTQKDLYHADFIAAPAAIITLIFVFGSLFASLLPIILGGACALIILTGLYFLGHLFCLSVFTLNIALLLGLCLSLDYSLFIISRFRDELAKNLPITQAIAITQAHAGKAIFFSGLAVFISLSGLFVFPVNILFSIAVGGLMAVFVSVLTAIVLLPAILSVLKARINLGLIFKNGTHRFNIWHKIAEHVIKRPLIYFVLILTILLCLGYPFLSAKFGISDYKIVPKNSEARAFYALYEQEFSEQELTPITLVVTSKKYSILSRSNLTRLDDLAKRLKKNPLIQDIKSIVTTDPKLSDKQYYALYHTPQTKDKPQIQQLLSLNTHKNLTVLTITCKYPLHTPQMDDLINQLHQMKAEGLDIQITGTPPSNKEVLETIHARILTALIWIMIFTYIILLLLLRSIVLPLKAIFVNLLSLCASYGALVLVFQEGYFSSLLNFEAQGLLDISLLVIIFCALFGFSMDYEVFLLTRIKEYYDKTHNTNKSIVFGIEKSSRIITSAALIVIVICGSFLVADVLMVKAFGLGIAVAIFVDAFLIRTLLVPSIMALLQSWNWYMPKWLKKCLPKC